MSSYLPGGSTGTLCTRNAVQTEYECTTHTQTQNCTQRPPPLRLCVGLLHLRDFINRHKLADSSDYNDGAASTAEAATWRRMQRARAKTVCACARCHNIGVLFENIMIANERALSHRVAFCCDRACVCVCVFLVCACVFCKEFAHLSDVACCLHVHA